MTALLICFIPFPPLSHPLVLIYLFFSSLKYLNFIFIIFPLDLYPFYYSFSLSESTIFYFNAPDALFVLFLVFPFLAFNPIFFPLLPSSLQYSFFILFFPIAMLQRTRTRLHRHADCQSAVLPLLCTFPLSLCNIQTHYLPYPWLLSSSMKEKSEFTR